LQHACYQQHKQTVPYRTVKLDPQGKQPKDGGGRLNMHMFADNFEVFGVQTPYRQPCTDSGDFVHTKWLTAYRHGGYCTDMGRLNMRVPDVDEAEWKQRALEAGMTLSGWIRQRCNAEIEKHRVPDVRMERAVPARKRGAGTDKRVSASIEPCRHGAAPGYCKHEECRR
jgi:hypothetical protein